MERASFRILGSVEAVRGGDVLNLGPPKQRAFLALLLTRANQTVSRDRLIDSLWEGEPPATAVKALQVFASRLRKALGPDADTLATSGNGYLVRIDEERLDAARFERALASGENALRRQEFSLAESVLGEALSFWRGPALADLEDEPFVHSESGRLEELRLRALEAKLEASLELGRHGEAVAELE